LDAWPKLVAFPAIVASSGFFPFVPQGQNDGWFADVEAALRDALMQSSYPSSFLSEVL
jgi:hypothetical protein